ncbi:bifunctional glutamate/proline--tRNA ligase-like isoform X5 [Aphis gossypii]|uniref:bifunctional glutamate/proline--tRNA ligase-like isoform X5 n=1 Tax=Aphis gossypii TaxID=80765 RepID=UPI002158E6C1|nr:bifunctional glutamate/proline--tRNA ligase-like isoform X5 [Aphis gossypii]
MSNAPEKDQASLEQQLAAPDLQNTNAKKQGSTSVLKNKKTDTKKNEKPPKPQKSVEENSKQQGKFVELPGAEMGKVVVRFPPEASGYLHIGHAKAALLNQHYQLAFNGRLIMRFDDTNPAKEKEDFEKVILEDVDMLKIKPDIFTYTSDHFDKMLDICENGMLKEGLAYVDDTDGDKIRLEREQRIDSINRNNSIEKNLELWKQMVLGTEIGQKCCVRAKIDMQSANGCLRDPTIYRCKPEHHPRTGDKYKVYPTYDFACPIVDSLEGVTHCLRTTEYTDRDAQYYWFCDALKLGTRNHETRPYVWSYSRLNMTNTVLSKRKLTWFVEQGHVDGWDDPRMPTVRGVLRRGMQVEALKQFIVAQGSSRTVTAMQWDKIWSLNRGIIDLIAPRHTTLLLSNSNKENAVLSYPPVEVVVEDVKKAYKIDNVPRHPKNSQLGLKNCVWAAPKILIDYSDAELLEAGRHATFINWGNLLINRIERNQDNKIEKIYAVSDLGNTDFKSTIKVTWLPSTDNSESEEVLPILVPVVCVYFDHLISKAVLAKDDDFKDYLNTENSRWELQMLGDSELKDIKKGDVIQLQRRGYFICDSTYQPFSIHSGKETPLVLFNIPDGHTKTTPITTVPVAIAQSNAKKSTNKNVDSLIIQINDQANKVQCMKANLEEAVKVLLALKAEYKSITGVDFPAGGIPTPKQAETSNSELSKPSADAIVTKINEQGDKVRSMKSSKAPKADVGEAVKVLLALKAEYKSITGVDFPAGGIPTPKQAETSNSELSKPSADAIVTKINEQGDKVRSMKSSNASKADVGEAVKVLLALKAEYKSITGVDFPAGGIPTPKQVNKSDSELSNSSAEEIVKKIIEQGDKVRLMKNNNASKTDIEEQVKVLLTLKNDYKSMTGKEYQPPTVNGRSSTTSDKKSKKKDNIAVTTSKTTDNTNTKKVTKLGLEVPKVSENLGEWYSQVLVKGEMIEYYDVSGCYVLRPWAYRIWELIQEWFDARIKRKPLNVRNCYFPMFVSQSALEREKEHIADFAPEVAWVTKSGETDLAEPIAIRPTSETGMYPAFAKWIQSYRDLPLKLNQWNSVVRWEFKHPQPFLRTREFLWQEGHNAYATREEAERDVLIILGYYEYVYKNILAVPVIKGKKTEKEKFAGGEFTTTCEAYVASSGRAIQGATSHYLGTNFAHMFDVHFEHPDTHEKTFVHQISFGMTTRTIGVMVMVHGDDRGLVLPPRIASIQVIIVPCGVGASTANEVKENLTKTCLDVCNRLKGNNLIDDDDNNDNSVAQHHKSSTIIRADTDLRDNYSPGWKFNHWELKGVPLRLEIGPKDLDRNQMVAVRRDSGEKLTISLEGCSKDNDGNDKMVVRITELLNQIQQDMYAKAEKELKENVVICRKWSECAAHLAAKRLLLIPFCGRPNCEDNIKRDTTLDDGTAEVGASTMGAKSLCVPFEQPKGDEQLKSNDQCIHPECGLTAGSFTLFGRSY